MRQSVISLAATASLLAAACSQPETPRAAESTDAPAPVTSKAAPSTAAAIPSQFRGVWDSEQGSCNPASDLRLEIGAVSIAFYESLGTVTAVTVESPDSITVDLTMQGEGEKWTTRWSFTLVDRGRRLMPATLDRGGSAAAPRRRCR